MMTSSCCFLYTGPTKKKRRSDHEANRGKSRQIAAKCDKIRQISFLKKWRSLFRKIATDRIAEGHPKNNGDHFGGEIVALFGVHHFGARGAIYFFNLRYRGRFGSWSVSHQAPIKFSIN